MIDRKTIDGSVVVVYDQHTCKRHVYWQAGGSSWFIGSDTLGRSAEVLAKLFRNDLYSVLHEAYKNGEF